MFARLFGVNVNSLRNTKTLQLSKADINIDQSIWEKFLIDLDLRISPFHDNNNLILISSPYSIEATCEQLDEFLDTLNLICISPFIIDYLFGNERNLAGKLNFITSINMDTIKELTKELSIIIIDITSSEMIKIPLRSSNLLITNSNLNNHRDRRNRVQTSKSMVWKMRWSTNSNITSKNFQKIMNEICDSIINDENMMQYFTMYIGEPPDPLSESIAKLRQNIAKLEKREQHLEDKIADCLKRAKIKSKNKDKKGALFELKKKKQLERQLESVANKRTNLEYQILPVEDKPFNQTTHSMHVYDCLDDQASEWDHLLSPQIGFMLDEDELEAELAELDAMHADELFVDWDYNVDIANLTDCDNPTLPSPQIPAQMVGDIDTDQELAELEAMMN